MDGQEGGGTDKDYRICLTGGGKEERWKEEGKCEKEGEEKFEEEEEM